MTIHVELKPEIAAQLAAEASAQGLPLEKVAERLLQEALASRSVLQGTLSVDTFHAMLESLASASEALPNLPTETFTRETFYGDRRGRMQL
jgi:hypothetical protein